MNRTQWILAIMAMGLTCAIAEKRSEGGSETITYDGNPDNPFPGAWGDPDVDCSDPHGPGESDCWKCEGSSPAVAVPKFHWILTRNCPAFELTGETKSNCYCVLAGSKMSDSITAEFKETTGSVSYASSITGCGGTPPDEKPIDLSVEWAWSTSGLATEPSAGTSQTATFGYTVPKGPFSIDVTFTAKGTPSDSKCETVSAGPRVVGKITGAGYEKYIPPPTPRDYPDPQYVEGIIVSEDGKTGFGDYHISFSQHFDCEPVCENSACPLYRLEGKFAVHDIRIRVVSCIKVTVDGCDDPIGTCKPRSEERKSESLAHEKKHLELWWDFIDEWNKKIENFCLFDSCDYANQEKNKLIAEFTIAKHAMSARQGSHCPDFNGDARYDINGCGTEFFTGKFRECN